MFCNSGTLLFFKEESESQIIGKIGLPPNDGNPQFKPGTFQEGQVE